MSDPSKRVEYFFDFGSPTSYLAWTQLPKIAAATGAEIVWRPMLLGGVFKATGNASPVTVPAKGRWMNQDIARWAARYGVPFRFNPHFPINTLTLMRGAAGLQMRQPAGFHPLSRARRTGRCGSRAPNSATRRCSPPTLAEAGFDVDAFTALVADPEVKARLVATTEEAVSRGVFGAPTFFVGEAMYLRPGPARLRARGAGSLA